MNFFLDILPDELLLSILNEWFDKKCLTAYDAALCNKALRSKYLTNKKVLYSIIGMDEAHIEKFTNWKVSRNVVVTRLNVVISTECLFHKIIDWKMFRELKVLEIYADCFQQLEENVEDVAEFEGIFNVPYFFEALPLLQELTVHGPIRFRYDKIESSPTNNTSLKAFSLKALHITDNNISLLKLQEMFGWLLQHTNVQKSLEILDYYGCDSMTVEYLLQLIPTFINLHTVIYVSPMQWSDDDEDEEGGEEGDETATQPLLTVATTRNLDKFMHTLYNEYNDRSMVGSCHSHSNSNNLHKKRLLTRTALQTIDICCRDKKQFFHSLQLLAYVSYSSQLGIQTLGLQFEDCVFTNTSQMLYFQQICEASWQHLINVTLSGEIGNDETLAIICRTCTHLKKLELLDASCSDNSFHSIATHLTSLEFLNCSSLEQITDQGIIEILCSQQCKFKTTLNSFHIDNCIQLTEVAYSHILQSFVALEDIAFLLQEFTHFQSMMQLLSDLTKYSNAACVKKLTFVCSRAKEFDNIDIKYCVNLLTTMEWCFPSLQTLTLYGVILDQPLFRKVLQQSPKLLDAYIDACVPVTDCEKNMQVQENENEKETSKYTFENLFMALSIVARGSQQILTLTKLADDFQSLLTENRSVKELMGEGFLHTSDEEEAEEVGMDQDEFP